MNGTGTHHRLAESITPVEMYFIGLLTALRVCMTVDKRLSSKVGTSLNQSRFPSSRDLLKLTKVFICVDIAASTSPGTDDRPIPQGRRWQAVLEGCRNHKAAMQESRTTATADYCPWRIPTGWSAGLKDGEYLWETYCWLSFCSMQASAWLR